MHKSHSVNQEFRGAQLFSLSTLRIPPPLSVLCRVSTVPAQSFSVLCSLNSYTMGTTIGRSVTRFGAFFWRCFFWRWNVVYKMGCLKNSHNCCGHFTFFFQLHGVRSSAVCTVDYLIVGSCTGSGSEKFTYSYRVEEIYKYGTTSTNNSWCSLTYTSTMQSNFALWLKLDCQNVWQFWCGWVKTGRDGWKRTVDRLSYSDQRAKILGMVDV